MMLLFLLEEPEEEKEGECEVEVEMEADAEGVFAVCFFVIQRVAAAAAAAAVVVVVEVVVGWHRLRTNRWPWQLARRPAARVAPLPLPLGYPLVLGRFPSPGCHLSPSFFHDRARE